MSDLCIRVMSAPGQDGCTIDDEIAGADEPTPEGNLHRHDQQGFPDWSTRSSFALPLLRG
jgi:hypothetical protein